mgnify:FL=1
MCLHAWITTSGIEVIRAYTPNHQICMELAMFGILIILLFPVFGEVFGCKRSRWDRAWLPCGKKVSQYYNEEGVVTTATSNHLECASMHTNY